MRLVDIRAGEITLDDCAEVVADPTAGAVAVFTGMVRDHDHGREVVALEYSSHPSALDQLRAVADGVAARDGVVAVAAVHRVGRLAVGDVAVVVAASAAHRDVAFTAARDLIDELKATVPIWKRQDYVDGTSSWVGCDAG